MYEEQLQATESLTTELCRYILARFKENAPILNPIDFLRRNQRSGPHHTSINRIASKLQSGMIIADLCKLVQVESRKRASCC